MPIIHKLPAPVHGQTHVQVAEIRIVPDGPIQTTCRLGTMNGSTFTAAAHIKAIGPAVSSAPGPKDDQTGEHAPSERQRFDSFVRGRGRPERDALDGHFRADDLLAWYDREGKWPTD